MKSSFAKKTGETPEETEVTDAKAEIVTDEAPTPKKKKDTSSTKKSEPDPAKSDIVTHEKQELATPDAPASSGGIEGDLDADDVKLPRINLVQSTSAIADEFTPGSFVLDKEIELGNEEHPVQMVTLWGRKLLQQKLPFGESDESPLIFKTRREVKEWGGTTDYSPDAIKAGQYFENLAHFVVAVKCPDDAAEDLQGRFELDLEGELWTLVAFTVNGSSYNAFGKQMITAAMSDNIWSRAWEVKPEKRSNSKGRWFVPVPRFKGKIVDPDRLQFFADLAAQVSS